MAGLLGLLALGAFAFMFVMLFLVALYVYAALALMAIAKRTKTENAWLAWIPIANIYLMTQVAEVSGWFTLLVLAGFVPILGSLVIAIFTIWLWWKVAEIRHRPGWWGILMIVPIANLIVMGILAWSKK